jgi:DNA-binding XRE family transcriptional regulator
MNPTEQYLHERVQRIHAANPDPILFEVALGALVEEVADACGRFVGEMRSTTMLAMWVQHFLGKMEVVDTGVPQEVRIGPSRASTPFGPGHTAKLRDARRRAAGAAYLDGMTIRRARRQAGMTQKALAEATVLSEMSIVRLERGTRVASAAEYETLRTILKLPVGAPEDGGQA